jgi:hypothetical protein
MSFTGGCFCGEVRYEAQGPILMRGQCMCRTCQTISGGGGNLFIAVGADGFRFTKGAPKEFTRPDPPDSPTRSFCGTCGVHLTGRSPKGPGAVIIKVGTLDDPGVFEGPQVVVWTDEMQAFHLLPPGVPAHGKMPKRPG